MAGIFEVSDLIERLENWGVAQRSYWSPGRCASIEGRYVPERIIGDGWESRRTAKLMIDRRDADAVEEAWRNVAHRLHKQILKLHYVWQAPVPFTCRRLAIRQSKDDRFYFLELGKAHRQIETLLRRSNESCHLAHESA